MKILNKIAGIAVLAFMLILSAPHKTMAQQEGEYISDQEFYDELQPYGTWIDDPQYGNVWVPDVEGDFKPYATRGYWAMTTYGNTWVSDYPWGWATFHYGRWHFDNYYGWEWVPGNEWAPAWVTWRNGGGYYGWAPMEPGITMDASFADDYSVPNNYWVFAPYEYINYTNVYNYYVPYNRTRTIIRNTTWLRNRYNHDNRFYNAGPRREDIQRYSHRPVRVYNINNVSRPSRITVNNNNINIYRPSVRQSSNARPARVVDGNAYKQQNPAQRIGSRDRSKGTGYNAANAAKLAEAARNNNPDSKIVRVNNNADGRGNAQSANPANTTRPTRPAIINPGDANKPGRTSRPAATDDVQQQQRDIDKQQSAAQQQTREQQRQTREQRQKAQSTATEQSEQQKQQQEQQRAQQQQQEREQRAEQQKQQQNQEPLTRPQRTTRPIATDGQVEQQKQQRDQQQQARQQQAEQQRQQRDQQQQARQQQAEQQRQQQRDQQQQARQQQAEQQRQQQAEQQKQQQEQQRQQQAEQQRQQQRDQQQQARQQQAEQQRQQQQSQQQQKQETPAHRQARP